MDFTKDGFDPHRFFKTIFANNGLRVPKYTLSKHPMTTDTAADIIRSQLLDEGNARQNLATFCQTYMEPEAISLMADTLDKNAIDKSEYPQTAELENRCVNIIANLWHAPDHEFLGTSTVGSSEACMLAGMAMKFRWRNKAKERGLDINAGTPNLIVSSTYQVCWKKFCVYWDIEMRVIPVDMEHLAMNTDKVLDHVDEYTIGIVGILGTTYTGAYEDIEALDNIAEEYNSTHEHQLVIHVDGASGAMYAPFVTPDLKWDFKLKNVVSISTSGHKYGLTFPGVGWVVWRNREYLPEELIFEVSYLGGSMPTMAINFSRSASQIIGQYYNFLRYGFDGYEIIHENTANVAKFIQHSLDSFGIFEMLSDDKALPLVCYTLKKNATYNDGTKVVWNLYDLEDRLMMHGWQVPAYPLPADLDDIIIQRIVCRADLSFNLAEAFINDLEKCLEELKHAHVLCNEEKHGAYGFTHN